MREVVIKTGARLHFGLFALDLEQNRQFGGIGMMIDEPGVQVRAEAASAMRISGDPAIVDRAGVFAARFQEAYPGTPEANLHVSHFIPAHSGLGSGTQLALAIGTALARLANFACSPVEAAIATGRGRRSAIGIHGFESGGFLVDGGHMPGESVGRDVNRIEVPPAWRIVLISPDDAHGLYGQSELDAFRQLPDMSEDLVHQLRELVVDRIVPAITASDFDGFTTALDSFGQQIGSYFAPVQGGVFCSPRAIEVASRLREQGVHAIVQSSWGPTVCAFARDEIQAREIADRVGDAMCRIVRPLNSGYAIHPA